jgi:hypothetical protein
MHPPLEWPDKAASLDLRIQRLSEKLLRNIREISLDDKPDQKGQPKYRFETKGKHQIIYYFLTTEQASKVESELINRWIDFWLSVLLDTPKATVTIIFCLHSERYWLPFRREWSSHCAKGLRNVCKDKPSVLLLSSLAAPSKDRDTYNWALKHCQRAWKIANLEHDTPFPLDTAILHKGAVNAFGWFRRKRPLLDLMPELSKAVEEAHKT